MKTHLNNVSAKMLYEQSNNNFHELKKKYSQEELEEIFLCLLKEHVDIDIIDIFDNILENNNIKDIYLKIIYGIYFHFYNEIYNLKAMINLLENKIKENSDNIAENTLGQAASFEDLIIQIQNLQNELYNK